MFKKVLGGKISLRPKLLEVAATQFKASLRWLIQKITQELLVKNSTKMALLFIIFSRGHRI